MPQDFSGQNLQGRSFKGQDLTGANFSDADIRGADFSQATLIGANFSHAQAGLPLSSVIKLLLISLFLSALSGFILVLNISAQGASLIYLPVLITSSVFAVFVSVSVRQDVELGVGAAIMAAIGTLMVAIIVGLAGSASAVPSMVVALTVLEISKEVTNAGRKAGVMAAFSAVLMAGVVARFTANLEESTILSPSHAIGAVLGLSFYLAFRISARKEANNFISETVILFSSLGGTNFFEADLTDANFTRAILSSTNFTDAGFVKVILKILRSTDFKKTNLTRTYWHKAKYLNRARLSDSILADTSVRQLLVSSDGDKKNYEGKNLRGANLTGVNLNQANLKNADISQATLRQANLKYANLTQVQAIGTDFINAYLTGACLEAWNIDSKTQLEGVDCQYVYLLEQPDSKGNCDRRPHDPDKVFQPGDFEKLYKKIVDTVQILLRNGINQEAYQVALHELRKENPEITLDSIKVIDEIDKEVLLTIKVQEETDKGAVQRIFEEVYEAKLEAQKQAALLDAEIRHGQEIQEITRTLAHNVSNIGNLLSSLTIIASGEKNTMTNESKNQYNLQQSNFSGNAIGTNYGSQIGTQNNSIAQKNLAEAAAEIRQLLEELEQTYPTDNFREQVVVVEKALSRIENDQTLKQRVVMALKEAGIEALMQAINHPLVNILRAALEGFQKND